MKQMKCSLCGAAIKNKNLDIYQCPYCGGYFDFSDENKQSNEPEEKPIEQKHEETKPVQQTRKTMTKRPTLNMFLFVFLLICDIVPGLIYFGIILYLQKKWDKENDKN